MAVICFITIAFQPWFRICHQEGLKLNGTHHFLVYAGDVCILGENRSTIKKKTEASLFDTYREVDLEANTENEVYGYDLLPECRTAS
jgi:hypothetical protein